jgi:Holliday junction DNA helicase RuvA
MFYYIKGTLAHLEPTFAVVDAGGVGYKLTISSTTHSSLPNLYTNSEPQVKLYTYMAVREDGVELFGFYSYEELSSFKMLTGVSGVGPKAAMAILSVFTPEKFALAVCTNDAKAIAKANGVGAKTAARIILELQDKLMKETPSEVFAGKASVSVGGPAKGGKGALSEAQDALMVLGYTRGEAISALQGLDPTLELEDLIKHALKKLMR